MNATNLNSSNDGYELNYIMLKPERDMLKKGEEAGRATKVISYGETELIENADAQPVIDSKYEKYSVILKKDKNGKYKAYRKLKDGRLIDIADEKVERIRNYGDKLVQTKNKDEGMSH